MVLFWRGVWGVSDKFGLTAELSLVAGLAILIVTGMLTREMIGE